VSEVITAPSRFAFSIGTTTFDTKGDAREAVRAILNTAELDERLVGDRAVVVASLFAMHPNAVEKAVGGVAGFMVRVNDINGTKSRGFHVIHDNGRTTPFSYQTCLNPTRAELAASVAMRAAIMLGQRRVMMEFFRGRASVSCPSCGQPMTKATAHVHHLPPNRFRDIAAAYVAAHGEPEVVKGVLGVAFKSLTKHHEWLEFHDARAKRTVVCAPCNYAAEREQ
tara:strand:+ start:542 stop:1213 length:672 start_codon:yes stop_codon:yes gene_type:complete